MFLNHQCSRQRLGCLQIFCSIVTLPCSPAAFERLECNWSRESRTWLTVIPQGYIIGVTVMMRRSLIYASLGQPTGQCDHDWYFLSLLTLNGAFKVGCRTAHPTASSRTPRFAHFKWSDFQSVKNNVTDINGFQTNSSWLRESDYREKDPLCCYLRKRWHRCHWFWISWLVKYLSVPQKHLINRNGWEGEGLNNNLFSLVEKWMNLDSAGQIWWRPV